MGGLINKFPERFAELLKERKMTQREFADKHGISRNTVNHWFLGRTQPNIETILLICEALDESADYLLGRTD